MSKKPQLPDFLDAHLTPEQADQHLTEHQAALTALGDAGAQAPSTDLRQRLMASISPSSPYHGFLTRAAEMLDLDETRVGELLARYQRGELATESPVEGLRMTPVDVGPKRNDCVATLIELAPGAQIPEHGHHGDEWGLILSGHLEDSLGATAHPGDYVRSGVSSVHHVKNPGDTPCLVVNLVKGGLRWR